jgi:hypothetical protein
MISCRQSSLGRRPIRIFTQAARPPSNTVLSRS